MAFKLSNPLAGFGEVHNADETQVFIAEEVSPGELSTTPGEIVWREIEANSFTDFGPQITTGAREYFNPKRTQGKAKVQKEEAMAGWQADVTDTQFPRFARAFLFHEDLPPGRTETYPLGSKPDTQSPYVDKAVPITAITAVAGADHGLTFDNTADELGTLPFSVVANKHSDIILITDYSGGPNTGKVLVAKGSSATGLTFADGALASQAGRLPPGNVGATPSKVNGANVPKNGAVTPFRVTCIGRRYAAGVVKADVVSTSDSRLKLTFTGIDSVPVEAGETICIGGDLAITHFDRTKYRGGFATIESKTEGTDTVLIFNDQEYSVAKDDGAAKTIDIYWGNFFINGSQKRTYQVERTLGKGPPTNTTTSDITVGSVTVRPGEALVDTNGNVIEAQQSDVILGCLPNECTVNMEQESFINSDFTFLPLDSGSLSFNDWNRDLSATPPGMLCHQQTGTLTTSRSGLDGYSTQTDVHRVVIDYKDVSTRRKLFTFVETATFSLNNNATGTPALGYKGYVAQNARRFEAKGNLTVLFEKSEAIDAIRNNTTCFMNITAVAVDSQHAVVYNIPNLTLSGNVAVEQGADVKMELEAMGFEGSIGHVASITTMLYIPKWVFSDFVPA